MNKYELFESIGYISDEKIEQADQYQNEKRKIKPVFRYAGIVLTSVFLIIGGAVFVHTRYEYENNRMLSSGETQTEDTDTISLNNSFIIYNNVNYYFSDQSLDSEDADSLIGSGKAVFYDSLQHKLTEKCSVYSIKYENPAEKIAVKVDNKYYIYTTDKTH